GHAPRLRRVALCVAQRFSVRVSVLPEDASMPGVASGLCDYIDHRTCIAPVFRTELVGDDHVLADEFGVRQEQPGSADAVVIVILPVDFLVVIAAAQAVAGESSSVCIGEVVAARCNHTRNKKSEPVKSFILLNSGKAAQGGSGKSIGYLRLRGFNQWRCGRDFQCGGSFTNRHFDGAEAAVFASSYYHIGL